MFFGFFVQTILAFYDSPVHKANTLTPAFEVKPHLTTQHLQRERVVKSGDAFSFVRVENVFIMFMKMYMNMYVFMNMHM